MSNVFLIIVILAIALILWAGLYRVITRVLLFRKSGLAYFKALLRLRGIDLTRVPDAALFDIIKAKIITVRMETEFPENTTVKNGTKSWRMLAQALETEADLIVLLMAEGPSRQPGSDAAISLTKHGVFGVTKLTLQANFTAESFAEATRKGSLYAELSSRISQRENS